MAKNFSVEVLINTAKATKDLQAAEGQVRALDRSLSNLTKTLKDSNGSLDAAAKSIASIVASSRDAARASEQLAAAKIKTSRAEAQDAAATDRAAVASARKAQANAAESASLALATARTDANARANERQATALQQASSATDRFGNSLSNQRYLLYDVGATYRTLAIAAQAIPAASLAVATSYEKSFAQVIRTSGATGVAVGELRTELKQLATEIPLSFAELSNIAKIGGQLGIPSESLGKFTEVVAKFVATADGVTIDAATESFGRLANLFAQGFSADETSEFFERIGSAISYTADNSVTSEAKISAMLAKIAPIGKAAGLSAVEVTAFASALSSVGLAPEISSGFLARFFGGINKSVASGGDALTGYSKILGITNQEFKALNANDPNAVLTGIVTELSKLDKVSQTKLLGDIGVTGVRDIRVIQGLAQNLHVLEQAQTDTAQAFANGSYLDQSSKGIFNTFAANLSKLASAFANLGDALGSSVLPVLSQVASGLNVFVQGFTHLIETVPALKGVLGVLLGFGSVAGVWLALKSAQAFLTAGIIGLAHAQRAGIASTLTFGGALRRMGELMLSSKGYTDAQTAAILRQTTGLRALSIAQNQATASTTRLGIAQHRATAPTAGFTTGVKNAGSALLGLAGGPIGVAILAIGALGTAWLSASADAKNSAQQIVSAFAQSGEAGAKALGESFATDKAGILDAGSLTLIGKTWGDIANQAGVSIGEISTALSGSRADMDNFIKKIDEVNNHKITTGTASEGETVALLSLIEKLGTLRDKMGESEQAAKNTSEAQKALGITLADTGEGAEDAELALGDYITKLGEAAAAAFGLVNAQGQVEASLEKLGAGLQDSTSFGADSEGGRANLANLQATLVAQATLFQQNIEAGKITAQQASSEYSAFVQGLMSELAAMGVDTSQFEAQAQNAVASVQAVFDSQAVELPVELDTSAVFAGSDEIAGLAAYLANNPLNVSMGLLGGDETGQQASQVVQYIAEATGLPFEAVITALTNPAAEDSQAVIQYIQNLVSQPNTAVISADTSTAISNVRNFAVYAGNQISAIHQALNDVANDGSALSGLAGIGAGILNGVRNMGTQILATPAIEGAKANKALIPTFQGVKRGYDDAGAAAGGAGKAAKGAGGAGKKAGDDIAKAAEKAKKEWNAAAEAIAGYASRVGQAFDSVNADKLGVQESKDAYYTVLNGINDRLAAQKKTLKDLRAENKALNAERKVQLNDAKNLEELAKYAEQGGDSERAKQYRDEAKALKASAAETKNKVDQNTKEARELEKGIGNLKGYTQAAIDNRNELRRLNEAGLKVVEAFAASGSSAKKVKEETVDWTKKAQAHGTELGYLREDVIAVTGKTKDYTTALGKVPKTIKTTITETKNTTLNAKNNTASGVKGANSAIKTVPSKKTTKIGVNQSGAGAANSQINSAARNRTAKITVTAVLKEGQRVFDGFGEFFRFGKADGGAITKQMRGFASGGLIPGQSPSDPTVDNMVARVDGQGVIGIRSGEFIQRQEAVDYYGSDIMNKINNMDIPRYALGGAIGNRNSNANQNGGVIDLSSETIQSLARLIEKDVFLYAGLEEIANSVNRGNQIIAQKGGHGVLQ